jgi:hypothetical protein
LAKKQSAKPLSTKTKIATIGSWGAWTVISGRLKRNVGRPPGTKHLFAIVAEKLPYESLNDVRRLLEENEFKTNGVYMAHDSMGVARYGGRGQIFSRLASHKSKHPTQLLYFSFYTIAQKNHEREIETVILRAAGDQMILNTRKVRHGNEVGRITDYEGGTYFLERQHRRGPKRRRPRGRPRVTAIA